MNPILVAGSLALSAVGLTAWRSLRHRRHVDLTGRWVVLTGCDSGLGQGAMRELLSRGAKVIAFTFTEEGSKQALEAGAALAPRLDLTDADAVAGVIPDIRHACDGQLWAVVHNAGVAQPGFVEYQPIANYRRTMEVNFFAVVSLTQALIPMLKPTRGRIVLVSSVDGIVSLPGNAPYDASKFALEGYADALRAELSFWDVQVSVINPATMRTPLAMGFFELHQKTWDARLAENPDGEWREAYSAEWLARYIRTNTERLETIAQDPKHGIRDIAHAVSGRHPRMRYLSGALAKTLFYALWVMPEHWALAFKKTTIEPKPNVGSAQNR
ncbi:MAG: SDR family NAD(P)-dependent oxidoreductase [Proteobacteria bacterium]|nr:SDR family NAD(P)-dependent oxidoreductase [Pseudomonadota bacterium]